MTTGCNCNNTDEVNSPKTKDYFDFDYYRCFNSDVEKVYGSDNVGLWKHFVNYGYCECRIHRFVKPCNTYKECCPKPYQVVVKRCHVKFPDLSQPPTALQPCCPVPPACCECLCDNGGGTGDDGTDLGSAN